MEEQILKILKSNYYPLGELDDDEQAAKEITSMVMEFIEWVGFNATTLKYREIDNCWIANLDLDDLDDFTYFTTFGLFLYWFNNIKKQ
jgi:hypothetical protein